MASELETGPASRRFRAVDPATGESGPNFTEASIAEVEHAARAARRLHLSRQLDPPAARIELLRAAARRLRESSDEIVGVCASETGLAGPRLESELERTWRQLEFFAAIVERGDHVEAMIDPADSSARPIPRPEVRRMLVPIGPVAVFGASNFPLAFSTAGGDTASALAAGCPVLVKGHPSHPGTGELTARCLSAAVADSGVDPGAFSFLPSAGPEVGEALARQEAVAAVAFTGSFAAGRALTTIAAARQRPIPVYAEMGSINPVVVSSAALAERVEEIASGLVAAVSSSGGQLCTKPGLVFVPDPGGGSALIDRVAALLDESEPAVLLNESVELRLRAGLKALTAELVTKDDGNQAPGFRHSPVAARVRARDLLAAPELLEERFGPFVLFAVYASQDELATAIERIDGQLTASVHHGRGDDALLSLLCPLLTERVGRVVFNGFPTGVSVTEAMQHGGPFPASTSPEHTSVGATAVRRFLRPVAWQGAPAQVLPPALRDSNPLGIWRRVDGALTRAPIEPA
jgi:acyl-CoA reductase-like NAD-dependent aldehyde dehydrogenase